MQYNVGDLIVTQHNVIHLVYATSNDMIYTKYFHRYIGAYKKECYANFEIRNFNWKHYPVIK
jgi:hypothetical protein